MQNTIESEHEVLQQQLVGVQRQRDASWTYAVELEQRCHALQQEITRLRGSRSWRWTAPLRRVFDAIGGGTGTAARALPARDPLVPPEVLHIDGSRDYDDYVAVGENFLRHFVQIGGLQPTDRVLDVGAATGRMARPLTRYLTGAGEYQGIEIVASAVEWAQNAFASQHPNFHFTHADIFNQAYNPAGRQRAGEYRFPFTDGHFDFAFATSVFTHMLPADVSHYLAEIARVLRPGGRCLATFFLLSAESRAATAAGATSLHFAHVGDGYCAVTAETPEAAIAFEEEDVRRMYEDAGLAVVDPIYPGAWTGRVDFQTYQDLVLAVKPS